MSDCEESSNARTLQTYEEQAERYIERTPSADSIAVAVLLALIPVGSRVLEIGSGPGGDALALEAAGLTVSRTDATRAFVIDCSSRGTRRVWSTR